MTPAALSDELASIWEGVRQSLRNQLPETAFRLWIDPLRPVSAERSTLHLSAPKTTRAWVERRYSAPLRTAVQASGAGLDRVVLVAAGEETSSSAPPWARGVESLPLDPHHTFERFVIGPGNRLAHAAALAAAESPGEAYNPLFLHGPPGLGKTHLLGAVAHYLRRRWPALTVHYTTADRFTADFVGALRRDGPERFKQRYRELDALLIDDVQALEGKESTQEEFVHTFNALHAAGKQIVLSSDRPPDALARLAERLRDRFAWGLCAELATPDLRTRTALLWRMALEDATEVHDPAALKEIAGLVLGNVRRLQGAMTRVTAFSSMLSQPITPSLARRVLRRTPSEDSAGEPAISPVEDSPSVQTIQQAVCSVCGVSHQDLVSTKRNARVSQARQLAMYLSREQTSLSLSAIAHEFNRDHTTVLHATRAVSARLEPGSPTTALLQRTCELLPERSSSSSEDEPPIHRWPIGSHRSSTASSPRSKP
ncbi:MAG TPA: chromosomal replication initiator protein DnaA [Solirubrobacterales bacterium]|nr:chromosomal replication initiator protein DnaA [Solirubrobacterales bacterium]